jgi:hypothetical protein
MTKAKQNRNGIWNWNVRMLYMSGALKSLATFSLGLEEVRQIKWENSGRSVLYFFLWQRE